MFALDPDVLATAKAARERMLERQHELETARADLNHEIRRLHAAGGSMREISEQLAVSHQRVHQIVAEGEDSEPDGVIGRLTERLRSLSGPFERFTQEAGLVVAQAQAEAKELGAKTVRPEHLLLALTGEQAGESSRILTGAGVEHEALRAAVGRSSPGPSSRRTPFAAPTKKALRTAFEEAHTSGETKIGSAYLLRGVLAEQDGDLDVALERLGVSRSTLRSALDAH